MSSWTIVKDLQNTYDKDSSISTNFSVKMTKINKLLIINYCKNYVRNDFNLSIINQKSINKKTAIRLN